MRYFLVTFMIVSIVTHAAFAQTTGERTKAMSHFVSENNKVLSLLNQIDDLESEISTIDKEIRDTEHSGRVNLSVNLAVALLSFTSGMTSPSKMSRGFYYTLAAGLTAVGLGKQHSALVTLAVKKDDLDEMKALLKEKKAELREQALANEFALSILEQK